MKKITLDGIVLQDNGTIFVPEQYIQPTAFQKIVQKVIAPAVAAASIAAYSLLPGCSSAQTQPNSNYQTHVVGEQTDILPANQEKIAGIASDKTTGVQITAREYARFGDWAGLARISLSEFPKSQFGDNRTSALGQVAFGPLIVRGDTSISLMPTVQIAYTKADNTFTEEQVAPAVGGEMIFNIGNIVNPDLSTVADFSAVYQFGKNEFDMGLDGKETGPRFRLAVSQETYDNGQERLLLVPAVALDLMDRTYEGKISSGAQEITVDIKEDRLGVSASLAVGVLTDRKFSFEDFNRGKYAVAFVSYDAADLDRSGTTTDNKDYFNALTSGVELGYEIFRTKSGSLYFAVGGFHRGGDLEDELGATLSLSFAHQKSITHMLGAGDE